MKTFCFSEVNWYDKILLNRTSKVILIVVLIAVLAPILLYYFTFAKKIEIPVDSFSIGTCNIPSGSRLSCGVGNTSQSLCHHFCCYDVTRNHCYHRLPSRFSYVSYVPWSENIDYHPRFPSTPFSHASNTQTQHLRISVDEVSSSHLTFILYDSERNTNITGRRLEEKEYNYIITDGELLINVTAPQGLIFTTMHGPLIAAENIWEISFQLTNEVMFGLGEIPLGGGTVKTIYSNKNSADAIPVIYAKMNGSYHGVLIENHTPTEISVRNDNQIVIRGIETEMLKFHLFTGPEPENIMADIREYLGYKNELKYWMLGAHICRRVS